MCIQKVEKTKHIKLTKEFYVYVFWFKLHNLKQDHLAENSEMIN